MTTIYELIQQQINPFDSTTFRPGNFWQEQQDQALTVASIHQDVVGEIATLLNQVAKDNRTRTLLLAGDSGAGKSYLLGRLKQQFNAKAFFSYIGPWPESDYIWRHTLRNTVDSLMYVPAGQTQSQLLLWLHGLEADRGQSLIKKLIGERQFFIRHLKNAYPSGIYNPNEFFGVLHDLTNPELYPIACEWLKGDHLDTANLKALRVKHPIDSETAARQILSNLGRIAAATQPIVLCFDNLDNIDRALDGFINLQALFNLNSIIHNQKLNNFLIIISIVTNTWKQNYKRVQAADVARIDAEIRLQPINLDQAEALWASRLHPIHQKSEPKPPTPIYPLSRHHLETQFPGGKTRPRYTLMLGRKLFQEAKNLSPDDPIYTNISADFTAAPDPLAAFELLWSQEYKKTQAKIERIRQFSAPELVQMLREALEALQVIGIQIKLLPSPKYASYSLSYHLPAQLGRIGVIWTEDPNLVGFFHLMKACEKSLQLNLCQTLYLIRAESLGTHKNQGNKIYSDIFTGYPHRHIIPDMTSLHYLATYHNLVNAACAGELVVGDQTPNLKQLQELIRESKILESCPILDILGIFAGYTRIIGVSGTPQKKLAAERETKKLEISQIKDYLLALVKTQKMMGRYILIQHTIDQFPDAQEYQINELIFQLCHEGKILIIDDTVPVESQLVCIVR
ncbi:MAG: hypothetical protein Fur0025_22860 [Oscillatoriaceae cyanobacterium]